MLNLVPPPPPRCLSFVQVGPRLLKLFRAGHCLLNLLQVDLLIIGSRGSDAASENPFQTLNFHRKTTTVSD